MIIVCVGGGLEERQAEFKNKFGDTLKNKEWSFDLFKSIVIECAKLDIQVPFTPEVIDLGPLNKSLEIMSNKTEQDGLERARYCLADTVAEKLIWGKLTKGDDKSVIQKIKYPNNDSSGRYKKIIDAHTHPPQEVNLQFSKTDFISFLEDKKSQVSIVDWRGTRIMTMKNQGTVDKLQVYNSVGKLLKDEVGNVFNDRDDILKNRNGGVPFKMFNQRMCVEFGMSMFIQRKGEDKFRKVNIFEGLE